MSGDGELKRVEEWRGLGGYAAFRVRLRIIFVLTALCVSHVVEEAPVSDSVSAISHLLVRSGDPVEVCHRFELLVAATAGSIYK